MPADNFFSLPLAHHKVLLWILAFIITISSAIYQRMTGPTYPARGQVVLSGQKISYRLLRSETVGNDAAVSLIVPDTSISGHVRYKRYNSHDEWTVLALKKEGNKLSARLPEQPAAGKLMYFSYLEKGGESISLTGEEPVVLRYKGGVPVAILIPHVFLMFFAMLLSNRAALEAVDSRGNVHSYMMWTIGLFFIGGFILGPLVQKFAFDALWTGIPFGFDLTDNKTLIAMVGWLWAGYKNRGEHRNRGWVIFAAVLMLAVYLIPHSVWGSELDYTKM